ncbi:hypothetical protein A3715_15665 [Oleiphilus sp. HI0009]|nr:hypothetical protein A3715_15665 [Oleiphilus sp. HI0009]
MKKFFKKKQKKENIKASDSHKRMDHVISDENFQRYLNGVLACVLLFVMIALNQKSTTLEVLPTKYDEKLKIALNISESEQKKKWGVSISQFVGNVSPKNIKFVANSILGYMAPDVFHRLSGEFGSQIFSIEKEGRRTRFVPTKAIYEEGTDKVFVVGEFEVKMPSSANISGPSKTQIRKDKVYELVIELKDGFPTIKHFDTYFGQPKDRKYLARLKGK